MNLKQLILSSGIIEDYVLGHVSENDAIGIKCLAKCYPDIQEEIDQMQHSLQRFAEQYRVNPPEDLKEKIWSSIQNENVQSVQTSNEKTRNDFKGLKILVLTHKKWIAAASILLIFSGLLFYNVHLHQQIKKAEARFSTLESESRSYQNELKAQKEAYNLVQSKLFLLLDPFTDKILLKGTNEHPESVATVLWNRNSQEVYLAINNLPQPPEDKQFQLWALVDGKPLDAGVIDQVSDFSLQKMKSFKNADAFAITLEQKGGSQVPTLEAMYVIGTL